VSRVLIVAVSNAASQPSPFPSVRHIQLDDWSADDSCGTLWCLCPSVAQYHLVLSWILRTVKALEVDDEDYW